MDAAVALLDRDAVTIDVLRYPIGAGATGFAGNALTMALDRQRIYHKPLRLQQLRAFYHTARLGTVTKAAGHMGVSPPMVSIHVRSLEYELEAVLIDRRRPGLGLTEAGERFYTLAAPLVERMEGLFSHVAEELTGRVDMAASTAAIVLPPYVARFRERHPAVRIRVRNGALGEGMALLREGEVEFVLGAREPLEEMSLAYREMCSYRIVLITARDHPLAGRKTVTPQKAAEWPAIAPPADPCSRRYGGTLAHQLGVDVKAAIEVGGWGVLKRYVEQGLGVSVVPSLCINETDQLAVIPFKEDFRRRSFGVYTRPGEALAAPARHLVELLIPRTS